ncbi:hypothetical protein [Poseidonibacter lekithochrous]|uniref:hypothetical protein n=1 Tax=Poseidonibacter lekithochrous TaxID=1904463 RepID=UPI0008FCC822|nr:hypothetical protein [Poseidonibacter lekithochrous]QKJ22270.1 hypothetical protein ALEK_0989 [Poseidonibacter lekithochrous]
MDKSGISIIAENGIAIYTVKPIIKELVNKDISIYIYTTVNKDIVSKELNIKKEKIININTLTNRYKSVFDFLLKQLLVNSKFSTQYSRINKTNSKVLNVLGNFFLKLPKPNSKKVNNIYSFIWKNINRKPSFKTKKLFVITRTGNSYLINNKHHTAFTLVESWDHPVKSPFFFNSKLTFVWNNSLKQDVVKFQNYDSNLIETIYPMKFRYIEELKDKNINIANVFIKKELDFIESNKYVLYICTYSNFSGNNLFEGEKLLIKEILSICKKNNKILYIKPHPHSNGKEFEFLDKSEDFRIGISATNNGYNYIFTDEDQYYKIQLLKKANTIINVGTTLVLESSLLNTNIVQIKLNNNYKNFKVVSENYHNKKYLNSGNFILDLNTEPLYKLEKYIEKENKFAHELKYWVTDKTYKQSIEEIVDEIS